VQVRFGGLESSRDVGGRQVIAKEDPSVLPRSTEMMGGMSPSVAVAELSRGNAVPRRTSYA